MSLNQSTSELSALRDLLDSTEDGVFVLDQERRFILFNKGCERLTGRSADEVVGTGCSCATLTGCRDQQGRSLSGQLCPGLAVFQGTAPALRQRMRIRAQDGQARWVETQYTALRDPTGRPCGIIGVMRDDSDARLREGGWRDTIEDLRAEVEALRERLGRDHGTAGLLARWPAILRALDELREADRGGDERSDRLPPSASPAAGTAREEAAEALDLDQRLAEVERRTILAAIEKAHGQRNLAARLMGISRSRLYRRMAALGIKPDQDS